MAVILRAEELNKVYRLGSLARNREIKALDNVNLTVESDHPVIISIVGESGSGKTTLAKTLLRLVEPTSGQVTIYDKLVAGKGVRPDKRAFLASVQPIFQNPFEAFSRYRPVDAYLFETATRVAGLTHEQATAGVEKALSAVGLTTIHLSRAEDLLRGKSPSEELFAQAGEIAATDCSPTTDGRGPVDYKRHLAGVLTTRALRRATARALHQEA